MLQTNYFSFVVFQSVEKKKLDWFFFFATIFSDGKIEAKGEKNEKRFCVG